MASAVAADELRVAIGLALAQQQAGGSAAKSAKAARIEAAKVIDEKRRAVAAASGKGLGVFKANLTPATDVPRRPRAARTGIPLPVDDRRNILITSALPYVNNVPHLGNIIGCVLSADVYARFCRSRGYNTLYVCGTDEYGTTTEAKAAEEGVSPRAICDKYHVIHRQVYEWFDIDFDYFGRTSTPNPPQDLTWPQTVIAQDIFRGLDGNGYIKEGEVQQVRCKRCSHFLADRFIEGTCPKCRSPGARGDQCDACGDLMNAVELIDPRCMWDSCRNLPGDVQVVKQNHLFLDLPAINDKLHAWFERSSTTGRWSDNAAHITKDWFGRGLLPRCVTRDLKWGTPVPKAGFEDKVFYVWYDAPIGYISITANATPEWKQWWHNPEKVQLYQFMGKDNVPFHTVIFPACLIGSGQPWTLLHHVSTTEFLNYEAGKFSKSRGVGVFGDGAKDSGIPAEVWRYYLLVNRPETADNTFSWDDFADKTNNELLKNLGNFINRVVNFADKNFDHKSPAPGAYTEEDHALAAAINEQLTKFLADMEAVSIKGALRRCMDISGLGNTYLQNTKPWDLFKGDAAAKERCATVVSVGLSIVKLLASIFEPFMPAFSDKVCYQLNMDLAPIPEVFQLGFPAGHTLVEPTPLFRPVTPEDCDRLRRRYGGAEPAGETKASEAAAASKGKNRGKKEAAAAPAVAAVGGDASKPAAAAEAHPEKPAAGKGGQQKGGQQKGGGGGGGPKKVEVDDYTNLSGLDLRVGIIRKAWPHPQADRLYCEEIDVGEAEPRQIASGLREHYSLEQMQGRRIIVVCNLKPRPMVGFTSHGMVLCAHGETADGGKVVEFVEPPAESKPGDRVFAPGFTGEPAAEVNPAKPKNFWTGCVPFLKVDKKQAMFKDVALQTSAGVLTTPTVLSGPIS